MTDSLGLTNQCPECSGDGWYVAPNHYTGEAEQVQCEACYGTGKLRSEYPDDKKCP